jgi:predicted PurR-regulated permease PerM
MWGAPGAILAVPVLRMAKIICDGIRPWAAIGHFIEEWRPHKKSLER